MTPTAHSPAPRQTHRAVSSPASGRAFTLIELLTVIAIIGILAAIIIPTVGKVRNTAQSAKCVSNLRQIGQQLTLYAGDNKGRLPNLRERTVSGITAPRIVDFSGKQLAYALWPYYTSVPMRTSAVNPFNVSTYLPLICPALDAEFRTKGLPGSNDPGDNQAVSYIINDRQKYSDATGVNTVFGYYSGTAGSFNLTTIEKKLKLVGESTALSTIWALQDGDQSLTPDGASRVGQTTFMSVKPTHGSTRNRVYLDGSVRKLDLETSNK